MLSLSSTSLSLPLSCDWRGFIFNFKSFLDQVTDGDGDVVLMLADEDDIVEDGEMDGIEILDDVGVDKFICKENYIRYQNHWIVEKIYIRWRRGEMKRSQDRCFIVNVIGGFMF